MNFSEKVAALRTARGLSQEALAEAIGVSRQAIGKWENNQSLPELQALIALSRFFTVSIDSLVNEHSCDLFSSEIPVSNILTDFLLKAKRVTYAGYAAEISPERPEAHEFLYTEDNLSYRDSYFGGNVFHGQEVVYRCGKPIWCMNYSGRTLSHHFSGDFLKLALQHGTNDAPYRGPALYQSGNNLYTNNVDGRLDWFSGSETIYFHETLVYECRYHGGYVK